MISFSLSLSPFLFFFLDRGSATANRGPIQGEELSPGIMWSALFLGALCSWRVEWRPRESITTTSTPITAIAAPDCCHQSAPLLDSTCLLSFSAFIFEIRNGRVTSQRLLQIRPFHNPRERKDKTLHIPPHFSFFIFCVLSNSALNTHTDTLTHIHSLNPIGFCGHFQGNLVNLKEIFSFFFFLQTLPVGISSYPASLWGIKSLQESILTPDCGAVASQWGFFLYPSEVFSWLVGGLSHHGWEGQPGAGPPPQRLPRAHLLLLLPPHVGEPVASSPAGTASQWIQHPLTSQWVEFEQLFSFLCVGSRFACGSVWCSGCCAGFERQEVWRFTFLCACVLVSLRRCGSQFPVQLACCVYLRTYSYAGKTLSSRPV